jgi:hypothetical protein
VGPFAADEELELVSRFLRDMVDVASRYARTDDGRDAQG